MEGKFSVSPNGSCLHDPLLFNNTGGSDNSILYSKMSLAFVGSTPLGGRGRHSVSFSIVLLGSHDFFLLPFLFGKNVDSSCFCLHTSFAPWPRPSCGRRFSRSSSSNSSTVYTK